MKGSIGLGLLLGILAMIFVPYVFMLINYAGAFGLLNYTMANFNGVNAVSALSDLFSTSFGERVLTGYSFILPATGISDVYNPNLLGMIIEGSIATSFMALIPPMLSWIVGGLLAGLLTQSVKKGVISAVVFVVVEILLYMLFGVLANQNIMTEILLIDTGLDPMSVNGVIGGFLGQIVITPLAFGIVGGVIGGAISKAAFGPEQI